MIFIDMKKSSFNKIIPNFFIKLWNIIILILKILVFVFAIFTLYSCIKTGFIDNILSQSIGVQEGEKELSGFITLSVVEASESANGLAYCKHYMELCTSLIHHLIPIKNGSLNYNDLATIKEIEKTMINLLKDLEEAREEGKIYIEANSMNIFDKTFAAPSIADLRNPGFEGTIK